MKQFQKLFAANKAIDTDQGCVGWNALPFAHNTLGVNDFAGQHGAGVHGKLQDVDRLFTAVHFHVRASRHIKSTTLRFLGRSVIEQTPKRSNGTVSFDAVIVNVDGARIGGGDPLPFRMSSNGGQQGQHDKQCHTLFQKVCNFALASFRLKGGLNDIHAPYYKVEHSS